MAHLKLDKPLLALEDAKISRALQPTYVKAWFREVCAFGVEEGEGGQVSPGKSGGSGGWWL